MIVYRDQRSRADPAGLLGALRSSVRRIAATGPPAHDDVVACVIDLGVLEAAVADALCPEADTIGPILRTLRDASHAAGHLLWHSWHDTWHASQPWLARLEQDLDALARAALPPTVDVTVPEGYTHYAVYPEMYLEAVRRHEDLLRGRPIVCLGIRSIGTSLSGVVAAACEEIGCRVTSFTLRPHGHPFDRRPVLTPELRAALLAASNATFLLVDEGPGISGSSMAGTAALLNDLGIPDDRILLAPSWRTDGGTLRSAAARERWGRHRHVVVDFEEVWLASGRLPAALLGATLDDISAGAWRSLMYPDPSAYPAVQPQHERRKYLAKVEACAGGCGGSNPRFMSFAGLSRYAGSKIERARDLAAAGFSPVPLRTVHGFLVREFVEGTPLSPGAVNDQLLDTMARYLTHLCRHYPVEPTVSEQAMGEMVAVNVAEGLGDAWTSKLRGRTAGPIERPVALDGRMLPYEWIRTRRGYLKTDALDHHEDHFFPGCQDIAWDLAGTCVEFDLTREERCGLIERYRQWSGDRTISARLPAYAVAYLAFRLGYASLSATVLGDSADGRRFARLADRYAARLRKELGQRPGE